SIERLPWQTPLASTELCGYGSRLALALLACRDDSENSFPIQVVKELTTRLRLPPADFRPSLCSNRPSRNGGAGNAGRVARTHSLAWDRQETTQASVTTGQAASTTFPAQWC